MKRSKEQFDSGNIIYEVLLFIPLNFNGTKEEIDEIIEQHSMHVKDKLMVKCGYVLDNKINDWVKDELYNPRKPF